MDGEVFAKPHRFIYIYAYKILKYKPMILQILGKRKEGPNMIVCYGCPGFRLPSNESVSKLYSEHHLVLLANLHQQSLYLAKLLMGNQLDFFVVLQVLSLRQTGKLKGGWATRTESCLYLPPLGIPQQTVETLVCPQLWSICPWCVWSSNPRQQSMLRQHRRLHHREHSTLPVARLVCQVSLNSNLDPPGTKMEGKMPQCHLALRSPSMHF